MHFPRLKDCRIDSEKTQQQIADYLYMQSAVYGRYERGDRDVPAWVVYKLAKYYNVSADYILGLKVHPDDEFPAKQKKK